MKKYTPVAATLALLLTSNVAYAAEGSMNTGLGLGLGLVLGMAALGGTLAQGNTARGYFEGVSRNPGAAGAMGTQFFVGMALIESLVLVAFGGLFLMLGKV
jgi:F0F1-type ATP synthase membrane subunit c/vacuolar-type H+-ATPase subunit K